jgi:phage regulator Rha-like protein
MNVVLRRTGREIKAAVQKRRDELREELAQSRAAFDGYSPQQGDIRVAGELHHRITEIEQELQRLETVAQDLDDDQVYELTLDGLMKYGLDADA